MRPKALNPSFSVVGAVIAGLQAGRRGKCRLDGCVTYRLFMVLPPLSVGEMTLRLYAALNYSQNSAHDLRRALNGA